MPRALNIHSTNVESTQHKHKKKSMLKLKRKSFGYEVKNSVKIQNLDMMPDHWVIYMFSASRAPYSSKDGWVQCNFAGQIRCVLNIDGMQIGLHLRWTQTRHKWNLKTRN